MLKRAAIHLATIPLVRRTLEAAARKQLWLAGFGSGGDVFASGERQVLSLLPPNPTIFDVGANTGQFLSILPAGQIHCFEPSSAAFTQIPKRPDAVLNRLALSDKSGTVTLHFDAPGSGLASLHRRKLDHFGIIYDGSEEVPCTTLDDYCQTHQVSHIDLLKLDVEGHELSVLRGSEKMLPNIQLVLFEFGGCNIDSRTFFQDFFYFFTGRGFSLYRIAPKCLVPVPAYRESMEQFVTTNYLGRQGFMTSTV